MTRPFVASTSVSARVALSLVALGLAACSFSYRSEGSSTPARTGKPAIVNDDDDAPSGKPTSKPVAKADPSEPTRPAEPATTEPEDAGPTRTPPVVEPAPVVEPRLTAVCRVQDSTLEDLCHLALDPIAADDLDAWAAQLDEGVVVTRPAQRKGMQRLEGPEAVRGMATRSGGLRALLNLRPTDRVVGTLAKDCRKCRRAFVSFEANTRSGTLGVTLEMGKPPTIMAVQVDSTLRRPHLEELRKPEPTPPDQPTLVPPTKDEPAPGVVQPKEEPAPEEPTLKGKPETKPTIKGKPEARPTIKAKPEAKPTIKAKPAEIVAPE